MKTAAVILNYNDAEASREAAERIRGFKNIDLCIIADNASTDESAEVLFEYVKEREKIYSEGKSGGAESGSGGGQDIVLILNDKNGGYGYGNNRGIRRAHEMGCELALIANPDAVFTEKTVDIMKGVFHKRGACVKRLSGEESASFEGADAKEEKVSVSGALMKGALYTDCAWPLLSFPDELMFAGPVTKRIFRHRVNYPDAFFKSLPKRVGAVHGSLFMVRIEDFLEAGGFDENMFLFGEEKALGQRMAAHGFGTVLTGARYSHRGSATMKKAGLGMVKRQMERQRSERYYYRKYLGAGKVQMAAAILLQGIVLFETALLCAFKKAAGRVRGT